MDINKNLKEIYRNKGIEIIGDSFYVMGEHSRTVDTFYMKLCDEAREQTKKDFPDANAFFYITHFRHQDLSILACQACKTSEKDLVKFWNDYDGFSPIEEIEDIEERLQKKIKSKTLKTPNS